MFSATKESRVIFHSCTLNFIKSWNTVIPILLYSRVLSHRVENLHQSLTHRDHPATELIRDQENSAQACTHWLNVLFFSCHFDCMWASDLRRITQSLSTLNPLNMQSGVCWRDADITTQIQVVMNKPLLVHATLLTRYSVRQRMKANFIVTSMLLLKRKLRCLREHRWQHNKHLKTFHKGDQNLKKKLLRPF